MTAPPVDAQRLTLDVELLRHALDAAAHGVWVHKDELSALLAVYEAWQAAPEGSVRWDERSWEAGGSTLVTVRVLDRTAKVSKRVRLVPSEAK
jgi:hypothetical protein